MSTITISIILPTYKNPPHLVRAINSVLEQSFTDWELIIIDDGLISEAKKKVINFTNKDSRIILLSNPKNLGIQRSLNHGLIVSKGKYVARIDDDDEWIDKEKLQKQFCFFENNSDYVLLGTDGVICDENFNYLQTYVMPKSDLEIRNRILFKNCFLHSAVMVRRSALDKVGGYSEGRGVRYVEDYDLWLRLGLVGKIENLDFQGVRIIVNRSSITFKNRMKQSWRDILLTFRYHKKYRYFYFAVIIGSLRLLFFSVNLIIPIPNKVLYKIQAMYKAI